jgi:predicted secreted protein
MNKFASLSRRSMVAGLGATLVGAALPGTALARYREDTTFWAYDPLWPDVEEAIGHFFGRQKFVNEGITVTLPQHSDAGSSVPLTVAIDSGMTDGDFPRVLHVFAHENPNPHTLQAWFKPIAGRAEFETRIRLERTQKVTVVAEITNGRYLRADVEASVSFGACAQVGEGTEADTINFQPQARVSVPATADRGAIIPVRALISHPMETGLRLTRDQVWIRQRIIEAFSCTFEGEDVFRTRPYTSVAANPYFSFFARAERSGRFDFRWADTNGEVYTKSADLTVI